MIKSDFHMHTRFCDGKDDPEAMVISAISKGFERVGIAVHSYTAFDEEYCIPKKDIPVFVSEVGELKEKYADRIKVFCGVEQDIYSEEPTGMFDYVIGSVHYFKTDRGFLPVDDTAEKFIDACEKCFSGDYYAMCEEYFNTVSEVCDVTGCGIIGHFSLVSKFNQKRALFDENDPRYVSAWMKAADVLIKKNVPFEINTGAISRGYRTDAYPDDRMIAYLKEKGASLILSSDAHSADSIGYLFDEYAHLTTGEYFPGK